MTETWALAALWLGLGLVATLLSIRLRVATALSEIVVGAMAQLFIGVALGTSISKQVVQYARQPVMVVR